MQQSFFLQSRQYLMDAKFVEMALRTFTIKIYQLQDNFRYGMDVYKVEYDKI